MRPYGLAIGKILKELGWIFFMVTLIEAWWTGSFNVLLAFGAAFLMLWSIAQAVTWK